jgi:hypothetical protein
VSDDRRSIRGGAEIHCGKTRIARHGAWMTGRAGNTENMNAAAAIVLVVSIVTVIVCCGVHVLGVPVIHAP